MIEETTPIKTSSNTSCRDGSQQFSPVVLAQSPAAVSPQRNLTGLPRVARDVAADVHNNIQKWNDQHNIGARLVKNIVSIKADSPDTLPPQLEPVLKDLYDVVQNLSIYSKALEFLASQMTALYALQKQPSPVFISLNTGQLADLVANISAAYKAEFSVKEYVLENIANSATKHEAMFHAARWTHQQHITTNIKLKVETLLTETGHRKIT